MDILSLTRTSRAAIRDKLRQTHGASPPSAEAARAGPGPRQWRHLLEAVRAAGPAPGRRAGPEPPSCPRRYSPARGTGQMSPEAHPRGANTAWIFTGSSMGRPGIRGAQKGARIWTPLQRVCAALCLRFAGTSPVKLRGEWTSGSSRWKPGWAIPVGLSALVTHRRALGPGLWALNYSPLSEFPVAIAMLLRRDGKPSGGAQTRQTFTMLFPALTRWDND